MNALESVDQYLTEHAERNVEQLKDFLRIASVSADSAFAAEMTKAAEFVRAQMVDAGLNVEVVETAGFPIVYGSRMVSEDVPTVLVYGHYDVQPPDPLEDWITPAFDPHVRDGNLYARGATDNKGQLYTHLKSIEAWTKTQDAPPVNVKVIIEGEEEVGSNNLDDFLETRKEDLSADVAVVSDTSQYGPGMPAITYGLRGIMACEVTLRGPKQDLHSGVFGGAIANPVNALAKMVGALVDENGRVTIPGFYDGVIPLTDGERKQFANLPFDEASFLEKIGVQETFGEQGFTTLERRWARPTCEINGFYGGYQGEGPKTIIPSFATAKITCRLVPDQNPKSVAAALKSHLESLCPAGVVLEFTDQHGGNGMVVDMSGPFAAAASRAIDDAFGTPPVLIREGGSIPVVASFREILGIDTLLLGWGQNTDNLHSPNEHFNLLDFHRGTRASAHLLHYLAEK
ncbi:Succinyl-diaminopimelate desuccinylase [Symmachiella macrocystis]|uniref:Succinyl-diaminopimelate desuccinylase n=1 Tax=Symmachiella macrocystis TaxID=2527985 RepID=A0A5C6BMR5_9PLAN|nr:dipeptidase [Symmachiella macrocystis]TWU12576.1 Succinyl-diaminopimelate desuccinylase [Symmachiella macrocystis]